MKSIMIYKRTIIFLSFLIAVIFPVRDILALNLCDTYPDPENHTWSSDWTDSFGQTTYSLSSPCKVFVSVPFTISASVVDANYPESAVGWKWSILDTPLGGSTETLASGGTAWIWLDENGTWAQNVSMTYTTFAASHLIEFSFNDFGQGSGGHNWAGSVVGDITVDPQPPVAAEPVSGTLFLVGSALLAGRRYLSRRTSNRI